MLMALTMWQDAALNCVLCHTNAIIRCDNLCTVNPDREDYPMRSLPRPNYRPILTPRQTAALERERIKRIERNITYLLCQDSMQIRDAVLRTVAKYTTK